MYIVPMTPEQRSYFRNKYHELPADRKRRRQAIARRRVREIQAWLKAYKETQSCERCGESSSVALDFHHLRDKEVLISRAPSLGWSIKRIQAEIAKCIVLCANCHRKETFGVRVR